MQNNNKKDYSKENFLRNGNKTQGQYGKSSFNNYSFNISHYCFWLYIKFDLYFVQKKLRKFM